MADQEPRGLDDIKVDIEGAEIAIEGDKAQVTPVVWTGGRGQMTMEFTLQKEGDTWRIVNSKRERRRRRPLRRLGLKLKPIEQIPSLTGSAAQKN